MCKKKKIYACLLICVAIACIGGVIIISVFFKHNTNAVVRLAIYTHDNREKTYYFVLDDEEYLSCTFGIRNHEDIGQNDFIRISQATSKIRVSEEEFSYVMRLLNELEANKSSYVHDDFHGGLRVGLLFNDVLYEDIYWDIESELFERIVDEIVRLSPIQIDLIS